MFPGMGVEQGRQRRRASRSVHVFWAADCSCDCRAGQSLLRGPQRLWTQPWFALWAHRVTDPLPSPPSYTSAVHLFLSPTLMFSADVSYIWEIPLCCLIFHNWRWSAGALPPLSHFGLTQEAWALCLCLRETASLIWELRQIFFC